MTLPVQVRSTAATGPTPRSSGLGRSGNGGGGGGGVGGVTILGYLGIVVLLLLVLLLQRTVLAQLDIPFGTPDLLVVVVASVALQTGPGLGAFTGFLAGFGADLLSDHALGRLAAVLCIVGYLVGMLRQDAERSVAVPLAAVVVGGIAAALLFAGTGALVDDGRAGGGLLLDRILAAVLYGLVVTPFLFPAIGRILGVRPGSGGRPRRRRPRSSAWRSGVRR
jgi:rod shape-determining protein MreD